MSDTLKLVETEMLVNLETALSHPVVDRRAANRKAAGEWAMIALALRARAKFDGEQGL